MNPITKEEKKELKRRNMVFLVIQFFAMLDMYNEKVSYCFKIYLEKT